MCIRDRHPPATLAVENGQVAYGDAKSAWRQIPRAPLVNKEFVPDFSFRERIDSHAGIMP